MDTERITGTERITVRRAERADAETVIALLNALAHYEKLDPPSAEACERLRRDGWGERPRFEAWLVERDGRAVGCAILLETYSTFLARPTLYLEDLIILPDERGGGAGRALFTAVAREAHRRGCGRMEWTCLDWNVTAQRFYKNRGARHMDDWQFYRLTADAIARLAGE